MYSDRKEITDSLLLVSLLMSQLHVVCGKRQKVCVICCVIGCGEELVWICLDRVCVGVTGQFVDEMSLYPGKLAALPVFFFAGGVSMVQHWLLMLRVESDRQIDECPKSVSAVPKPVSGQLSLDSGLELPPFLKVCVISLNSVRVLL